MNPIRPDLLRSAVYGWAAAGLVAVTAVFLPALARAVEPERREATVISARVWDGYDYKETFLPSTGDELTIISGRESAIVFVRTFEYYWPLSRQVYVDFERRREVLDGELVIRRGGETVAREGLQPYALLFPEGAAKGGGEILWGGEAERAHAEYQESERRFAREFSAAQRAHSEYQRRLIEAGTARLQGAPMQKVDPPAPLPEPSLRLVTTPAPGFRVQLESGRYTVALERDGAPVPGTRRTLRVVGSSGRAALVADIVPEERWTRPLASNSETARLFVRPGAVFYLTLTEASRFDEADYLPVVNPQAEPVAGRAMWVRRRPAGIELLRAAWDDGEAEPLARKPLKVEQTRGSGFGYRVRPAQSGETSDLDAFTVQVPSDEAVKRGSITLEGQGGTPFMREVVVVHPRHASAGLALALLPLAGWLLIYASRRSRAR